MTTFIVSDSDGQTGRIERDGDVATFTLFNGVTVQVTADQAVVHGDLDFYLACLAADYLAAGHTIEET